MLSCVIFLRSLGRKLSRIFTKPFFRLRFTLKKKHPGGFPSSGLPSPADPGESEIGQLHQG